MIHIRLTNRDGGKRSRAERVLLILKICCLYGALFAILTSPSMVHGQQFIDVAGSAGVDYLQYSLVPDPALDVPPTIMSGGAAAGDYDADGCIDLFVTRVNATDILFRNRCDGSGTFEDATASAGLDGFVINSNGAAWGDIDNDGDLDLYVTAIADTRFYLFINDGAGQFTEEALIRGASVSSPDVHYGYSVSYGDYNIDGWLDIHTTEWRRADLNPTGAASNSRLLRNRGAEAPGFFEDVTEAAGVSLDGLVPGAAFSFTSRFTDLDQDGWPDLAVVSDFGNTRLFWNNGDGTFTDGTLAAAVGTDENGMGFALGDYDGDGDNDWFVTSIYDPDLVCDPGCPWGTTGNRLYRNEGNRVFSDQTDAAGVRNGFWGWGAAFFDYDNDADLDLIMTNGFAVNFNNDPMRLWQNDGSGQMTEISAMAGITDTRSGKGLLTFDYENDGDLDVFVVNNSDHPVLYQNNGGNQSDWLRVKLIGQNNKFGIGSWVRVTPVMGGPSQLREISAGTHFLGQSDSTAHFGLGQGGDPVARVQVGWLKTRTLQVLENVPRNTTLEVQEPYPPLYMKINGEHPDSRVVFTPGPFTLTLDVTPGPFTESFDWYFAIRINSGNWKWFDGNGYTPTQMPMLTLEPLVSIQDQVLADTSLAPGLEVELVLYLRQDGNLRAIDWLTVVVTTG